MAFSFEILILSATIAVSIMKPIRVLIIALILVVIYYFASPQIPPIISVQNLATAQLFKQDMSIDVTMTNYSLQPKEVYLGTDNELAAINVYVDVVPKPTTQPIAKENSFATMTIPPLGHVTKTVVLRLKQNGNDTKQVLRGDSSALSLTNGDHTFVFSWGGYVSNEQRVTVQ